MILDEIKQELDKLNQNDIEKFKLFIRDKSISNEYVTMLINILESHYSSFLYSICDSLHIIKSGHYPNEMQIYKYYNCCYTLNI